MILMPIPNDDFDPSETSIPWKILKDNNLDITFATPDGNVAKGDKRMLTGEGLGIWKRVLMADKEALKNYDLMLQDSSFKNPIKYKEIDSKKFKGVILPGGHAPGMRTYLESKKLQTVIVDFFRENKPVGAICHGVLLAARSINPETGKSVLHDLKTTSLLHSQEMLAYYLTGIWLDTYYRTYPMSVENEVKSFLKDKSYFQSGNMGIKRDTPLNMKSSFTVLDKNYLSERWPGDAYKFAFDFLRFLNA